MNRSRQLVFASWIGVVTFVVVAGIGAIVTFMLPKTYAGTARIHLKTPPAPAGAAVLLATEAELAHSEPVLTRVVDALDLNKAFGEKYLRYGRLKTTESLKILGKSVEVRPLPDAESILVSAYSDKPDEAARWANGVAEVYCGMHAARNDGVFAEVAERAVSNPKAVRPNIPVSLATFTLLGMILGAMAGGLGYLAALLAVRVWNKAPAAAPTPTDADAEPKRIVSKY